MNVNIQKEKEMGKEKNIILKVLYSSKETIVIIRKTGRGKNMIRMVI